ncbi:hypothetical protein Anapl_13966 [Anas platyrhynchos]|uniref:Uncharacterized protein n=1 Tax=Anas platyrhynchos TaxID=8839 RepID=R0M795_ANAPL|nr:hypothetical protein Anapl_13966 [Anas platyrhynchos]
MTIIAYTRSFAQSLISVPVHAVSKQYDSASCPLPAPSLDTWINTVEKHRENLVPAARGNYAQNQATTPTTWSVNPSQSF